MHALTQQQIEEAAAEAAAQDKPPVQENIEGAITIPPTLGLGAKGPSVTKLVNLLAVLGYATNSVIRGGEAVFDESVLVDVQAAQAAEGVVELATIDGAAGELIEGVFVAGDTWHALYEAAGAKLEAQQGA